MPEKQVWKSLFAEFLGTALLVLIGCGSGTHLNEQGSRNLTGIGLCWGLTVATLAQSLGHISGCHINPAVTIAMVTARKIQIVTAFLYVGVQCAGAVAGAAALKALSPEKTFGNFAALALADDVTVVQGFILEVGMTFVLLLVIFASTDENRKDVQGSVPLAIGLCVASLVISGGPFTGTGINPARALGPSVVTGLWRNHWLYWLGPIIGAVLSSIVYQQVLAAPSPDDVEVIEAGNELKETHITVKQNGTNPPV